MAPRTRGDMIAETRSKLMAAGRQAFATVGYAEASMDSFTSDVGLTRGALYHHFGDKKGLLAAVIAEIDAEMCVRLDAINARAANAWDAFLAECIAYLEMALEPEIQRIVHRDGPAVLGDPSGWPNQNNCIASTKASLDRLMAEGYVAPADSEALARMVNAASLQAAAWIANSEDPEATSERAIPAFRMLLEGLRSGRCGEA